jgi:diketogulonate reductase-like aldo/keto reductase
MQLRVFGSSNIELPAIGQGTWKIHRNPRNEAVKSLQRGIDLGMTHIDTAEMYEGAEALVREAIRGRRDQVYIVSKVLPSHGSKAGTIAACEASLGRLGTDYLDCYLLHWRGRSSLEETFSGFEALMKQGKIRSWGVSNFNVRDLEETMRIAPKGGPVSNQVLYNPWTRAIEHDVIPWCRDHGIAVTGYTTFGQAQFPAPESAAGAVLTEIGGAHNATPHQVVLAWAVRDPILFAIPKSGSPQHTEENAAAGDLVLTEEEVAMMNLTFPLGPRSDRLPMG